MTGRQLAFLEEVNNGSLLGLSARVPFKIVVFMQESATKYCLVHLMSYIPICGVLSRPDSHCSSMLMHAMPYVNIN